ncbi:MAG: protein kinase, partial [Oscillospiraceae bacterium]|nr:protein kinase [Oscillospiraceae bacterium]
MRCYKCMEEISNSQICPYCGYDISTETENKQYLTPGTKLGGIYTVGTVIGAGGFGVTYIGWDESLNRKVAIKEYFPSSLSTRIPGQTAISAFSGEKQQIFNHGKERFIEEARLLMRFTGEEGIVSVYDVLEANGTVYMVMEYVEGITLKQNIEQFGTIPEQQLLGFIVPMLLSLKYVHNAGFTHRDISPDNIMCQPDGNVKLLDFGAARYSVMEESKSLSVIVKQGFTPIEQYQSHGKQGPWTDLYAIGATMYKALTGITPDESLERMAKETLKKPSQCGAEVSENTENAIMAALNIRAEHRPQDVDEFLAILTGEQKGGLIGGKRPKKGIVIAVASALAVALGGGMILWSLLAPPPVPPTPPGINVPNAINKTDSEAEVLFTENQLHMVVTGGKLYDAEMIKQGYIAENLVVEQEPTSGTTVDPESIVGVVLSKGKEKEYIPSVTDKLIENALHDFDKYGFGDDFEIELEEEYSDTNMAGTVISQSLPEDAA